MYCTKITYRNFRNIEEAEFYPDKCVNVLYGNNAQGKTNLLEGIYYFACGKSFRSAKDKELIKFDKDFAELKLEFTDEIRQRKKEIRFSTTQRRVCLKENIRISRMSEFVGDFRAVLFSPEHLSVVKNGPSERRNFEDVAISQLYPVYLSSLSRYLKLLSERNAILKTPYDPNFKEMLSVISEQMAELDFVIAKYRREYTEKLSKYVKNIISDMTMGKENAEINYETEKSKEDYLKLLTENTEKEIRAGNTLYGVHKDDLCITLNGKDSRLFASQGQQRSIALAMKLSEGEISKEITGEYPVFLFDDILSELDSKRKEYILSGLENRQVIITCCEKIEGYEIFSVENGKLENVKKRI